MARTADATADAYAKKLVMHEGLTAGDIPNDLSVRLAHNPAFAKNLEQSLAQYQNGPDAGGLNQKEIAAILNECTIYDGSHKPGDFKGQRFDLDKGGPDGANATNFIQLYRDGSSLGVHALPDATGGMTITGINITEVDPQTQQVKNLQFRQSPGDPPGTLVLFGPDGNPLPKSGKMYNAHLDGSGQQGDDLGLVVFKTGPEPNAPSYQFNPVSGQMEPHQDNSGGAAPPPAVAPGSPDATMSPPVATPGTPEASPAIPSPDASMSPAIAPPDVQGPSPEASLPPATAMPPEASLPPATAMPPEVSLPPATATPPEASLPPATAMPPEAGLPPATAMPPEASLPPATATPPEASLPPATATPPEASLPPATATPPQSGTLPAPSGTGS